MNLTRAAGLAVTVMLAVGCSAGSAHPGSQPAAAGTQSAAVPSRPPTAAVLASRLKAAGLPVTHLIVYNAVTDPNHELGRQGGYTSKVAWRDHRAVTAGTTDGTFIGAGIDSGGGIEVFPAAAGAQTRYHYLRDISSKLPSFSDGYDYLSGTAVLRLSRYRTPAQAHAYQAAFAAAATMH